MIGRLLTAREVAERLAVTSETILRWTRRGELPAFCLPGGAIRYDEAELDTWLGERATGATDRGGDSHHGDRAQLGGYARLSSIATATAPQDAATTEEDS
jgi:excisionase family DNA binding protein